MEKLTRERVKHEIDTPTVGNGQYLVHERSVARIEDAGRSDAKGFGQKQGLFWRANCGIDLILVSKEDMYIRMDSTNLSTNKPADVDGGYTNTTCRRMYQDGLARAS
jgi:hypothetical protein